MKITIEKNLVELFAESPEEKVKVETLWRILIDCNGPARKLVPVGEYAPAKGSSGVAFMIEGAEGDEQAYTVVRVQVSCTVWCDVCNKQVHLQAGDALPLCCGKLMEIVD